MTSSFAFPPWLVHVLALVVGAVVYLGSNQEFLNAVPHGVAVAFHIAGPLFAYLGISQITTTPKQAN